MTDRHQQLRLLEAVLFATREPLSEAVLAERMPDGMAVSSLIEDLKKLYANRGVNLVRVAGGELTVQNIIMGGVVVDDFTITKSLFADLDHDCSVGIVDFLQLLARWTA